MVLGQEEGQAKREEGGKEPVGSPWAVDGLDPPSAHAHQPSRHYFCWAWALGGVNGRSIIRRLSYPSTRSQVRSVQLPTVEDRCRLV